MKALIRKNKDNSTTKVFRVKCTGKKGISEKSKYFVHQKITAKKNEQFRKRARLILFRAKHYVKKSMGSKVPEKKCMSSKKKVLKKKEFILFGAKHSANKSMGSKKNMSSKKKELILFSGQTLCQKKSGSKNKSSKKKRNSYLLFSTHTLCRKKYKCQKKV